MVNTAFQLEGIQNHLQDKPLGPSMSEFLDWVRGGQKTHSKCEWHHSIN